jgi:hypothetical protein
VAGLSIDHLVYACRDLAAGVAHLESRFGVRAGPGGKHAGLGTHNALLSLGGDAYLEIIAPDPDQRGHQRGLPFGLGDGRTGLAGWALSCPDIDAAIAAARGRGYDPGDAAPMHRITPSGSVLRWRLTSAGVGGGPVPFLIDWGEADHPARSAPAGLVLEDFWIEDPDPGPLEAVLGALGSAVQARPAPRPALAARIRGPLSVAELR